MTKLGTTFGRMVASVHTETAPSPTRRFLMKRTREPQFFFGFTANSAIEWLSENECSGHDESSKLLDSFLEARLLHFPDDRMCVHVKNEGMEMQPTAKGFAYLEEWFRANSATVTESQRKVLMDALASPYNSMELVYLERSLLTETPLLSTGLAMWLWRRMLGVSPKVFDGTFCNEDKQATRRDTASVFNVNCVDLTVVNSKDSAQTTKTPYWNAAMIHPSSSSAMQYWGSEGVRLFKSLDFERPLKSRFASVEQYTAAMCLSGKAMWQWLMECTTVEKSSEATKIVRIFVNQRFIQPIGDRLLSLATYKDDMPSSVSRLTFYRFTQRGMKLCAWEDAIDVAAVKPSSSDRDEINAIRWMLSGGPSDIERADPRTWAWSFVDRPIMKGLDERFTKLVTLDLINREPGLKVPFRKKVIEWHCEENLRYLEDSQRVLLLLKASQVAKGTVTRLSHLQSQVRTEALELKRVYIELGSPFQLNISHQLREKTLKVLQNEVQWPSLLDRISGPLLEVQTECTLFLTELVSRFILDNELRRLPLSSYIVGCYTPTESTLQESMRIDAT